MSSCKKDTQGKEEKMEIENEGTREDEMYLNPLENNVNIEIEKIDDISTLQEDDEMNKYHAHKEITTLK